MFSDIVARISLFTYKYNLSTFWNINQQVITAVVIQDSKYIAFLTLFYPLVFEMDSSILGFGHVHYWK